MIRIACGVALSQAAVASLPVGPWLAGPIRSWTDPFVQWDATLFTSIAQHGYRTVTIRAFFPVDPLAIRTLSPIFGYPGAAIAVSWIACFFAVWGVMDVAERFSSRRMAWVAGTLLVWNPVSVFLLAGYADALLVAVMIWSLRFCLDGRWWPAALLAGVASGVLPQGIASAVVVALAVVLASPTARGVVRGACFGLVGLAGIVGYLVFSWVDTGNPLIVRTAQAEGWHARLTFPFHMVFADLTRVVSWHHVVRSVDVSRQMQVVYLLDVVVGLLGAAVAVVGFWLCRRDRRLVLPAVLFSAGLMISVVTVNFAQDSTDRFILCLAPLYVIAAAGLERLPAATRSPVVLQVLAVSAAAAAFFGVLFNLGYWMT